MNIRRTKSQLGFTAVGLVLASVGVVVAAGWWPYQQHPIPDIQPVKPQDIPSSPAATLPALSTLASVWQLDLRRPLFDNPTRTITPTIKRAAPRLSARLAGTVIEPGHSIAMFVTKKGGIDLKSIGEMVGDAQILSITQNGVTVQRHGKKIDLSLEREKKK